MPTKDRMHMDEKDELNLVYLRLRRSPKFRIMTRGAGPKPWRTFNEMDAHNIGLTTIASHLHIPETRLLLLRKIRTCIIKWDSDLKKVKDCINGKIDP